jgi:hypothetical protein
MRYIRTRDLPNCDLPCDANGINFPSIDASGSVRGMQSRFGWPRDGHVRIGGYIYLIGAVHLDRLRRRGLVRGE